MTKLSPNPFSPYADADPNYRHLVPSLFGAAPESGVLAVAACGGMAVVPEGTLGDATDALREGRLDDLPEGLCPNCLAVATGEGIEAGKHVSPGTCSECGDRTLHGTCCALCRQELHDQWQVSQENAPEGAR